MAEIIKGWSSSSFLRLQNKVGQPEGVAASVVTVKSGWTAQSGARVGLMEREKGKRPQAGSAEGLETDLRGKGTYTL